MLMMKKPKNLEFEPLHPKNVLLTSVVHGISCLFQSISIFSKTRTYIAFTWQLGHRLLNSQVTRSIILRNLHTTVGTCSDLVTQPETENTRIDYTSAFFLHPFTRVRSYLPSANKCVKQAAHIRCPIGHYMKK
jgi:hypothetical protein